MKETPPPPQPDAPVRQAKKIQTMFSAIAEWYDFLNRLLSFGVDIYWRKRCVRFLKNQGVFQGPILDLASGTGDLALALEKSLPTAQIVAADFSLEMLKRLKKKMKPRSHINIVAADGTSLPFHASRFEGVMIGFGIRNFTQREVALKEISRVLKPGGTLAILEFSLPDNGLFRRVYTLYFEKILPFVGGIFSRRSAYQYLPASVMAFPPPVTFSRLIATCGFSNVRYQSLTGGIATLYTARKPY